MAEIVVEKYYDKDNVPGIRIRYSIEGKERFAFFTGDDYWNRGREYACWLKAHPFVRIHKITYNEGGDWQIQVEE